MEEEILHRSMDYAEIASEDDSTNGEFVLPPSKSKVLSGLDRELSDEELKSPAVSRMLAEQVDALKGDVYRARKYVPRFHKANTEVQVLKEKVRSLTSLSELNNITLASGGVLVGIGLRMGTDNVAGANDLYAWTTVGIGLLFMFRVFGARLLKRLWQLYLRSKNEH